MSSEALTESNDLLARPPLVGLALSRSLGFIVIGRLAARFGIAVRLMPSPSSGTTAMVSLPPTLITDQPRTSGEPQAIPDRAQPQVATPPQRGAASQTPPTAKAEPPGPSGPMARRSTKPAPTRQITEVKKPDNAKTGGATPAAAPEGAVGLAKRQPAKPAATEAAPEAAGEATSSGLAKRVPRSAGGQRAVPGGDGERSATQNRRSPEEVRSMLSRYRSGMQKGRTDDDVAPDAAPESADSTSDSPKDAG